MSDTTGSPNKYWREQTTTARFSTERLTPEQLSNLYSYYWGDWSNWLITDQENGGLVLSVIDEVRELRAEVTQLRAAMEEIKNAYIRQDATVKQCSDMARKALEDRL